MTAIIVIIIYLSIRKQSEVTGNHFQQWVTESLQLFKVAEHSFAAVSGNSHDGACFKYNKQTWQRKKQWYRDNDFSKSTH